MSRDASRALDADVLLTEVRSGDDEVELVTNGRQSDAPVGVQDVLNALPHAVVVTDGAGRIAMWNARATELYGWEADEVLGTSAAAVFRPLDGPDDRHPSQQDGGSGNELEADRIVLHRDGSAMRVRVARRAVHDSTGQTSATVWASEDVGELRLAQRREHDLNERLRLALDAGGLGIWEWDIATGRVAWDERMEALFGLQPGQFDGTFESYQALLHPDDRATVAATIQQAVQSRQPYRVEHRISQPDGSLRWVQGAGRVVVDADGEVVGAIGCSVDATDRVQLRLAAELAAQAEREAADRERLDRERLEFLAAVNDALAEAATTDEIMVAVTRTAVPRLGDWCSIFVLDDDSTTPRVETFHVDPKMVELARDLTERYPFDPDAPTGMPAVIRTGVPEFFPELTPQVVDEVLDVSGYEPEAAQDIRDVLIGLELRSSITVPLVKLGRTLGGLSFITTSNRRPFTEADLELARLVATRVASSLEHRRLSDAQRRIASTLQASLLPARLPDVPHLDVAVRYWAAGEGTVVGGDFYDLFRVDEHRWAAIIGDVCGTGPAAASLTSMARHTIRQAAWRGDDPVTVLQWLNRAVIESIGRAHSFLTTSFVTLDQRHDGFDLTVTCAGHPPGILLRSDGTASPIGKAGSLVGVLDQVRAETVDGHLADGDALVLYTDGLTDLPPPHGLTIEQATELVAVSGRGCSTAEDIAHALERAVESRRRIVHRRDDIAIVVLKACG